jgi:hypothetical protein
MDSIENRLDLINRYNAAVGFPGIEESEEQVKFIKGEMTKKEFFAYVRICEYRIYLSRIRD